MSNLLKANILLLSTLFLLFSGTKIAIVEGSSWGQCSCPVTDNPSSDHAQYSTITNASLCVNASGSEPICRIEVHCLQDGVGPSCSSRPSANSSPDNLLSKMSSLIEIVYGGEDHELYRNVTEVVLSFQRNRNHSFWPSLDKCFLTYQSVDSSSPTDDQIGVWLDESEDEYKFTCVNTSSGWMHVVISRRDEQNIGGEINAISFQFAPPHVD